MRIVVFLLALSLAGCLTPAATPEDEPAPAVTALTFFTWEGARLRGAQSGLDGAVATTKCLAGVCELPEPECTPENCERVPFVVPVGGGDLSVRLRWPGDPSLWFTLTIEDAHGAVIAKGRSIVIDHDGAVARIDAAPTGELVAVVALASGVGDYQLDARLEVPRPDAGEWLPDLVTLRPTDLRIAPPSSTQAGAFSTLPGEVGQVVPSTLGAKGCASEEAAAGARRCMRFSNLVGNIGLGPLEVRLAAQDGATSGAGGAFRQRIFSADGTWREVEAGAAEFHAVHGHWHNAAANDFTVYEYAEGVRGEAIAEGRKTGICFADVGVVWEAAPRAEPAVYQGATCFNPAIEKEWSMGIAPGWYDEYPWILTDQFVDLAGVADGQYLLCATTNAVGALVESDATNNEACTPFRLEGDTVTELLPAPYYAAD